MSRALQRVGKSLWQACATSAPAAGASLGTAAAAASRRNPAASSTSSHAAQAVISAWRQQQARTALALVQTAGTSSMLSPRLLSSTGRHGQQQQCGEGRQLCACRPAVRVQVCGHEHVPHLHAGKCLHCTANQPPDQHSRHTSCVKWWDVGVGAWPRAKSLLLVGRPM